MIQLTEEEIAALRAVVDSAYPRGGAYESLHEKWKTANHALRMIEGHGPAGDKGATPISRMATDDASPKYLVQIDLFNIYSSKCIDPEKLKLSMQSLIMVGVLNEIKIHHQNEIGRPLASEDALGMLRNIRHAITVTRVR